jgi:nitrite reductase/ring-hydroxylating ferredoxin subunit
MRLVRVGARRIVLAHTDNGYAAFADGCSHRGASLADGVLIGKTVQCLWHGSRFDCATGDAVCGPAKKGVQTYPVTEDSNGISITVVE